MVMQIGREIVNLVRHDAEVRPLPIRKQGDGGSKCGPTTTQPDCLRDSDTQGGRESNTRTASHAFPHQSRSQRGPQRPTPIDRNVSSKAPVKQWKSHPICLAPSRHRANGPARTQNKPRPVERPMSDPQTEPRVTSSRAARDAAPSAAVKYRPRSLRRP